MPISGLTCVERVLQLEGPLQNHAELEAEILDSCWESKISQILENRVIVEIRDKQLTGDQAQALYAIHEEVELDAIRMAIEAKLGPTE